MPGTEAPAVLNWEEPHGWKSNLAIRWGGLFRWRHPSGPRFSSIHSWKPRRD